MREDGAPILNYEQVGRGDETLVFLHGFMGTGADWKPLVAALEEDFTCLLVDLPGHGESVSALGEEKASLAGMGPGVLKILDELGFEKVHLLGYSMGGRIALQLALDQGPRFRSLILESASPGLSEPSLRVERARLDERRARDMEERGLNVFLKEWYQMDLFAGLRESPTFEGMLERRESGDLHALSRIMEEMSPGLQPDLWPRLGELHIPSLWLAGARDAKYTAMVREAASRAPKADVEIIPGAGHNIHLEAPGLLATRLSAFVKAQTS